MTPASPVPPADAASVAGGASLPATPAEIDASCRWPVLVLLGAAVLWLVPAGALAVLAAIKLHAPGMLADCPWLTYGRVQPAAWNAFVFGFGIPAGLAVAFWLIARLGRTRLVGGVGLIVAAIFWNAGLCIGVVGILGGDSTGIETLELPLPAAAILFVASLGMAGWGLVTFAHRREADTFVSLWYLVGALFLFPWIYGAAVLGAVVFPMRGVLQVAVQAWFTHNLLFLWFGLLGLGVLFYLLPKLTAQAVPSRSLAMFGFWALAAFGGFGGLARYAGGPFPAWLVSVGVVSSVLCVLPVLAVGLNLWPLLRAPAAAPSNGIPLRFARVASVAYLIAGVVTGLNSLGFVRRTTQFTLMTAALDQLLLQGFVGLALLGATYYLVPRLTAREWPSRGWAAGHFWCAALAVAVMTLAFAVGGWLQGHALNDPALPFFLVIKRYLPFASMGTLTQLLLLLGNMLLVLNLGRMLLAATRESCVPAVRQWVGAGTGVAEVKP